MSTKIGHYQWFFSDQLNQMQLEQKTLLSTPIGQLVTQGAVSMGYAEKVIPERGHIVIKFPNGYAPRLKVPKSFFVIKKGAYAEFGAHIKDWKCTLDEFRQRQDMHSTTSDFLPLFFIPSKDGYDHVECTSVSVQLFDLLKQASESGKSLSVLIFDPFAPVDYFLNLKRFMDLYPDNPELQIEPKINYEDWHPEELSFNPDQPNAIAETVSKTLESDNCCILQGPPGTGKSYVIATIIADYLRAGKTVCATTMANKGLIELALQPPLKEFLEGEKISKTNISADERRMAPKLKAVTNGFLVPNGELLCVTNYILSGAFSAKNVEASGVPSYDLVVIEEASQAFLSAIVAFKSLGERCLIVGDPMQLPPIVKSLKKPQYKLFNASAQIEGMKTFALGTDTKAYRIITSFRLSPNSAKLTGIFYDNRLSSVNPRIPDFSSINSSFILKEGGIIYQTTGDNSNGVCTDGALEVISSILSGFKASYPEAEVAIITPFKESVKELQKHFLTADSLINLTIETVDRIQGMTVDYTIMYIPGWKPSFALDENRFNVATSRSRSTTLVLSDAPLENLHSASAKITHFLNSCDRVDRSGGIHHIEVKVPKPKAPTVKDPEPEAPQIQDQPGLKILGKIDLSKFERPKKEISQIKKNYYVIDTNVFVNCPDIISKIDVKYPVILSAKVIDELDKLKVTLDESGKVNVQKALRFINQAMDQREITMELANLDLLPDDFNKKSPDNMILTVALKYKDENPILLTSDNGLQVKAKGLGISTVSLREFLKK